MHTLSNVVLCPGFVPQSVKAMCICGVCHNLCQVCIYVHSLSKQQLMVFFQLLSRTLSRTLLRVWYQKAVVFCVLFVAHSDDYCLAFGVAANVMAMCVFTVLSQPVSKVVFFRFGLNIC